MRTRLFPAPDYVIFMRSTGGELYLNLHHTCKGYQSVPEVHVITSCLFSIDRSKQSLDGVMALRANG